MSALTPVLQDTRGSWIGWSGIPGREFEPFTHDGINLVPVELSQTEYEEFYVGFCNGTLWPLYHDSIRAPEFHRHWWGPYQEVNRRFAEATVEAVSPKDIIWVQDYQLQLVPEMVRAMGKSHRIGFYLHIPFPPVELFAKVPWRNEILRGLLGSDVVSFQSRSSRTNFSVAARRLLGAEGNSRRLVWQGRDVDLQVAPIGIDSASIRTQSSTEDVKLAAKALRTQLGDPDVLILGVDRLDYTKGIDLRMRALQTLLERRPELKGRVAFVQIAVPSRQDVEAYQQIRAEIEGLVGRINGDLAEVGSPAIHHLYRTVPFVELLGYYRAADVMLVTPLRDGMNLVAKEYVATRYDNTGALILSEFAGAAEQLGRAYLVNPYDLDGLVNALEQVIDADPGEVRPRMESLRRSVNSHDVYWWAERCLQALGL